MSDTSTLKMPSHTPGQGVPNEDGQDFWHNTHGTICRAWRIPGYALQMPDGRLHCNRCGHVTPEPVVTTYSVETGKVYLTWEEYVEAETNGYVVVVTTSRRNTAPAVTGPYATQAEAAAARQRLRKQMKRDEDRDHGPGYTVRTFIRVLAKP